MRVAGLRCKRKWKLLVVQRATAAAAAAGLLKRTIVAAAGEQLSAPANGRVQFCSDLITA